MSRIESDLSHADLDSVPVGHDLAWPSQIGVRATAGSAKRGRAKLRPGVRSRRDPLQALPGPAMANSLEP